MLKQKDVKVHCSPMKIYHLQMYNMVPRGCFPQNRAYLSHIVEGQLRI